MALFNPSYLGLWESDFHFADGIFVRSPDSIANKGDRRQTKTPLSRNLSNVDNSSSIGNQCLPPSLPHPNSNSVYINISYVGVLYVYITHNYNYMLNSFWYLLVPSSSYHGWAVLLQAFLPCLNSRALLNGLSHVRLQCFTRYWAYSVFFLNHCVYIRQYYALSNCDGNNNGN